MHANAIIEIIKHLGKNKRQSRLRNSSKRKREVDYVKGKKMEIDR